MQQSMSWRAKKSQEIPCILWNPKVCYCIHDSPPPIPVLSEIHQIYKNHHDRVTYQMTLSSSTNISVPSRVATAYRNVTQESEPPVRIPPWISVDTFGLRILEEDSAWYSIDVAANASLQSNIKITTCFYSIITMAVHNWTGIINIISFPEQLIYAAAFPSS